MSFDFTVLEGLGQATHRLYWPYLLSSALVAVIISRGFPSRRTLWRYLSHPSTHLDLGLFLFNGVLKITLFALVVGSATAFALPLVQLLRQLGLEKTSLGWSPFQAKLFLTFFVFILSDFFRFAQHYLMHRFAWALHRVHHSAELLTPLTLFRTHPVESFISYTRNIVLHAITIAVMMLFFDGQLNGFDFLGVNLFGFLFNCACANLRHSPIPLSFGPLEYLFISPRMHQIHHSANPKHFNKNYGVALSLWDQMTGSFYRPTSREARGLIFGLGAAKVSPAARDQKLRSYELA